MLPDVIISDQLLERKSTLGVLFNEVRDQLRIFCQLGLLKVQEHGMLTSLATLSPWQHPRYDRRPLLQCAASREADAGQMYMH